jgi:hypothetical protein
MMVIGDRNIAIAALVKPENQNFLARIATLSFYDL